MRICLALEWILKNQLLNSTEHCRVFGENILNQKSVGKFFGSPYFMLKIYGNTRNLYRACSMQCSYIPKEFPNVFFSYVVFFVYIARPHEVNKQHRKMKRAVQLT